MSQDQSDAPSLVVTVVIPVRNSAELVAALLDVLERQTLPHRHWNVIVGDDGSVDDLGAAVVGHDRVTVTRSAPHNEYAARNRAASLSSAPVLAFCDADCLPEPDWLKAGLEALEDGDIAGGAIRWRLTGEPTVWTLLGIDSFIDPELAIRGGTALGGNLFVRRTLFDAVGGFDDELPSHGDFDFTQRCVAAGGRLKYASRAVVSHPTYQSAREVLRKVVSVNRAYAAREARAGRRPTGIRLRQWVPIVQTLRNRRRNGRPFGLNSKRLTESGIEISLLDEARALPWIYIGLPYIGCGAQLLGYYEGRRWAP